MTGDDALIRSYRYTRWKAPWILRWNSKSHQKRVEKETQRERVKKKWILCDCGVGYGVAIPIANASWMLFVNWQRVSIY